MDDKGRLCTYFFLQIIIYGVTDEKGLIYAYWKPNLYTLVLFGPTSFAVLYSTVENS